jgi:hypothetical protein
MMVTCHSNTLLSSTSPAEKPSTGCLARSLSCFESRRLAWLEAVAMGSSAAAAARVFGGEQEGNSRSREAAESMAASPRAARLIYR